MVPKTDVLYGGVITAQIRGGESLLGRELLRLNLIKAIGLASEKNIFLDVRCLFDQLIGCHPKALK